jgi:nucleoside-diphosphate-sugar epimerase
MDLVLKIHQITESKSELLFGALTGRINEIQDSKASNLNLRKIGWNPQFTVETAIKRIVSLEK